MKQATTINVLQFICPTGFYGAERWILALAKHLPADVRCDLAVTQENDRETLEIVKHYQQLGLTTHELPMAGRFDWRVVNKLVTLIKSQNIHLIHTHGYKSDILGVLAARKAGIPCIVTPHGFENSSDLKLRLFIWLGNQAMRFATKVVPLSEQLCEDVKRFGVPANKVMLIRNGVDLSEVEAAAKQPNEQSYPEKRIGFIGQMISRKNIRHILDIFQNVHRKFPATRLILLGDGESRAELEDYAKTLDCHSHIEFLGFRDDRLALLKSFDLFVMTSTLEGIPRCLMEATAMGIPVAAYDIPGIDKLIEHQKTGLLAPLNDKDTLQQYWEKLLFNDEYAQQIAEAAKAFVNQHYSGQRMADEYAVLFNQMLGTA
ncbi:MAG: glycosyltransferase family 4 protein [Paraglaciecola sp.]|nr:glycosyltransferase family 4 protein [Paraglaciecola sp.]NCT47318.1 glycosyltransferase family 4 protein [Paraglaciecola sp.]